MSLSAGSTRDINMSDLTGTRSAELSLLPDDALHLRHLISSSSAVHHDHICILFIPG